MPNVDIQPVTAQLTPAAIFLVATVTEGEQPASTLRTVCGELSGLVRAIGFRDGDAGLSCVMAFGSNVWDRLFTGPRPRELHPFRAIDGVHHAVATPGDVLFHIRAKRMDLCFELARHIRRRLGEAVTIEDETHGFKYMDNRDLIGFVDGTENPVGEASIAATTIGDEDAAFAGGSYVIVQKYLHDIDGWDALPVAQQEGIIGRRKLDDIELDDDTKPGFAHNNLTSITQDGEELEIVRDNMPFGRIGSEEYGTYFIGYARSPARIETMLENMFIGRPAGNYDRLLDYSRAVTGSLFFVPSADFLDAVTPDRPAANSAGDAVHGD